MVDDVGDLLVEQPRVDGVADRAHAGDGVVELEVAIAVPGQRADPVAWRDAQPLEHPGEPAGTPLRLAVGVAVPRPFSTALLTISPSPWWRAAKVSKDETSSGRAA